MGEPNSPADGVFDYIVVGGGTAGCVVAARLAEDGGNSVCLIEAGEDARLWIAQRVPVGCFYLLGGTRGLWHFESLPQGCAAGRSMFMPRGHLAGGSSAVNGMIWVVGDPAEYDQWAADGCKGWDFASLSHCLSRVQDQSGDRPGTSGSLRGPVPVHTHTPRDVLSEAFLDACRNNGIPRIEDYNNGAYRGAAYLQFNTWRGLRYGVRETYLRSARRARNFRLVADTTAERILFEGRRAIGVSARSRAGTLVYRARREVIVCAGTFASPQLLERSGIGDPVVLAALSQPVVAASPSVGKNLRDHYSVRLMVEARGVATLNRAAHDLGEKARLAARYLLHGDGMLATVSATAHALTPVHGHGHGTRSELKLQLHHFTSPNARRAGRLAIDRHPGFSISTFVLRPRSTGSVHCRPGGNAQPAIDPGYLTHQADLMNTVQGIRLARRIVSDSALAPYVARDIQPGPELQSDDELADFVRQTGQTSYHPVGTCRMGADEGAVVDQRLRVRGVECLRVIDASVMPTLPSSNTHAPTILVAERGVDFIREDASAAARRPEVV